MNEWNFATNEVSERPEMKQIVYKFIFAKALDGPLPFDFFGVVIL